MALPAGTRAAETSCTPRIAARVFDTGTSEQIARWGPAKERLLRLRASVSQDRWNRVAEDCLDVVDPNAAGLPRVTIHDWLATTRNGQVTDEEIAAVVNAVDELRDSSGLLHMGIVRKSGVGDGSRRWMLVVRNDEPGVRGNMFELVAVRNLIRDGQVNPNRLIGVQIRHRGLEGDAVELLDSDRFRFLDVKARGGNYDLDELDKAYTALTSPGTDIEEVVFAIEEGTSPTSQWVQKFDATTQRLVTEAGFTEAEARRRLSIRSGGFFR